MCRNRKQERNGETSPQGNGGLRTEEVCGKDGEYHAGGNAGYMAGGRSQARHIKHRDTDRLYHHRQTD